MKMKCELKGLKGALDMYDVKKVEKALNLTLQELGKGVRTVATREISAEYNVKQKDLRAHIAVSPVRNNAVEVTVTGARPPLTEFGATQTRRGVSFRIRKGGGRSMLPSAFITTIKYGRGVFAREKGGKGRVPRGPVSVFTGPSIPQLFSSEKVMSKIRAYVGEADRIFWSKLQWLIGGKR